MTLAVAVSLSKQRLIWDPILAWAFSATLAAMAAHVAGANPWSVSSYIRGDGGIYIAIGTNGYSLVSCATVPGYDPTAWCGSAGWMPGYPLLIRLLAAIGMDSRKAAFLISNVAYIGCLVLLRRLLEQILPDRNNTVCFFSAAVFPGGIYLLATFPISLLMFCSLLALVLLSGQRFLWASIVSGCGAFTYATGFLVAGVVSSAVLMARDAPWAQRLREALLYGAIAFSGLVTVMIMHQLILGRWNAFFLVQAKYGHGIHDPLDTVTNVWRTLELEYKEPAKLMRSAQSLIVCAIVPALLVFLLTRIRQITRIEWLAAIHVGLFWIFPLVMGPGVSLTRAEANLLPLTLLMARLPIATRIAILGVFATLYFEASVAFFESILV